MTRLSECGSLHNLGTLPDDFAPREIQILDLTLEGDCEEMAGVGLSHDARLAIARSLDGLGVARIAVLGNSPNPTPGEIASAHAVAGLGLRAKLCSFTKSLPEIDTSARIGLWGTVILIAVNPAFFPTGRTGADIIAEARAMAGHARDLGLHVTLMAMDTTRADPAYVAQFLAQTEDLVDEFAICDSIGVASPWGFEALIRAAKGWTDRPLQVHCHNHTGMGVANTLAAIRGGADVIHSCVNGLGEFAGQPALEEIAVAIEMHLGLHTGLSLTRLTALSRLVEDVSGIAMPPHKAITGRAAFAIPETEEIQEALNAASIDGRLDEALTFPPAWVGNRAQMSMGRKCNRHTVAFALAERGLTAAPEVCDRIAAAVRASVAGRAGHVLLTPPEFDQLLAAEDYAVKTLQPA
ncbi:MAG: hypothetical protein CML68_09740 [Rhodobacteraceae bacterium]|nr:hypothetical protein [Paracoccaceae bacterium]